MELRLAPAFEVKKDADDKIKKLIKIKNIKIKNTNCAYYSNV